MHGKARGSVCRRCFKVCNIASVLHSGILQFIESLIRISHTIDCDDTVAKGRGWLQKKLANLIRTLIVSPVSNPDHVISLCFTRMGAEDADIGRFVQSPYVWNIELTTVNLTQCLAKDDSPVKLL